MEVQDGSIETTQGWNNKWVDDESDTRKIMDRILPKLQRIDLVLYRLIKRTVLHKHKVSAKQTQWNPNYQKLLNVQANTSEKT
jgi:hypothetical protein